MLLFLLFFLSSSFFKLRFVFHWQLYTFCFIQSSIITLSLFSSSFCFVLPSGLLWKGTGIVSIFSFNLKIFCSFYCFVVFQLWIDFLLSPKARKFWYPFSCFRTVSCVLLGSCSRTPVLNLGFPLCWCLTFTKFS